MLLSLYKLGIHSRLPHSTEVKKQLFSAALLLLVNNSTKMGIQKSFLRHIAVAFLAANIVAQVHCLPKGRGDELRRQEMERIRGNILTRLGLTEPLDSSKPLTVDEEAVVATFREYQMAKEGRRVHAKDNSAKLTFVGQLHKQGTCNLFVCFYQKSALCTVLYIVISSCF